MPRSLGLLLLRASVRWTRMSNRERSAREVFTRIYERKVWGDGEGEFHSGRGSTPTYAARYAEEVRRFIEERDISVVVDLGCGDFAVGRALRIDGVRYVGVDIVEALVRRNQEVHGGEWTSFLCLDIATEDLPDGDLCLIRQVFQHLSNSQILSVLEKVRKYRFVIVTEHHPSPAIRSTPNIDKPHGPDTRVYDDSGVFLDHPPFDVKNLTKMFEMEAAEPLVHEGEKIRTYLIDNTGPD